MLNIETFKAVFFDCKKKLWVFSRIPKNKEDYINKLYQMYMFGRDNRESEILDNLKRVLLNNL